MISPIASYVAVNKDNHIRHASSSGGVFTALAEYVFSNNGVVCGAAFDENHMVHHIICTSETELEKLRGSKYVHSELGHIFANIKSILDSGQLVLFTGVGCQTAGLKKYLRQDYPNLIIADVLCHGGADPKAWEAFIKKRKEGLTGINFRDKSLGWEQYNLSLQYGNKERMISLDENTYIKGYFSGLFYRKACLTCPFRNFNSQSDITLADAWGAKTILEDEFCKDDKGTNLVFVNTQVGAEILKAIEACLYITPVEWQKLIKFNPAIYNCPQSSKSSNEFWRRLNNGEDFDSIVTSLTRPGITKRLEIFLTPLFKKLGIKGFTNRFKKGKATL